MARKVRVAVTKEYFDENGEFMVPGPGLKLLDELDNVEYKVLDTYNSVIKPEELADYDLFATMRPEWHANSFAGGEPLIGVLRHGAGFDTVDIPALNKNNVLLCINSKGVRRPMAVTAVTLLLAISTRLGTKIRLGLEGRWADRRHYSGWGLVGKTVGIVGAGSIGKEIFRLLDPFGMNFIASDPYADAKDLERINVRLVEKDELLRESDYVILTCLLNDSTYHFIGESELESMKDTAQLINIARGPVVDEKALIKALQNGVIRGAGIDVFEDEPTPVDNPLLHMDNVIAEPHALGWTDESFMNIWNGIIDQIKAISRGEMPEGLINSSCWEDPPFREKYERFLKEIGIK